MPVKVEDGRSADQKLQAIGNARQQANMANAMESTRLSAEALPPPRAPRMAPAKPKPAKKSQPKVSDIDTRVTVLGAPGNVKKKPKKKNDEPEFFTAQSTVQRPTKSKEVRP